jgi:hypothetical protein
MMLFFALVHPLSLSQVAPIPALGRNPRSYLAPSRPLTFEANQGQGDPQVKFISRARGYTAFLTAGGVTFSLRPSQSLPQPAASGSSTTPSQLANTLLQLKLVGANSSMAVVGENPLTGKANYFIGRDPAKWHTNVATYAKVRYKTVYPGIDLLYYGSTQRLEYDLVVSPGADPSQIQFEILGADHINLDLEGNLVLQTRSGELRFQNPTVYQESNGSRIPVPGSYVVEDSTHIAFRVAAYDPTAPLVIDPVLVYSTYLGGSGDDQPYGIAVDSTGAVYVAGFTDSTDFPLATIPLEPT